MDTLFDLGEDLSQAQRIALDSEAVVLGSLMQLPVTTAAGYLKRLDADDFADPHAATVYALHTDMAAVGVPSLDPAAVLGHARYGGTVTTAHAISRLAAWLIEAYRYAVPEPAVDYHINLVIEGSYRRHVMAYATRLHQAATTCALDGLDEQITTGLTRLTAHRRRLSTTSPRTADRAAATLSARRDAA